MKMNYVNLNNNGYMKNMSELQKYKNKDISYIELIVDVENPINKQSKITLIPMHCDNNIWHTLRIDTNGHFYAHSCWFHSINYQENNGYDYETMQLRKPYNILGYTDLVLKE